MMPDTLLPLGSDPEAAARFFEGARWLPSLFDLVDEVWNRMHCDACGAWLTNGECATCEPRCECGVRVRRGATACFWCQSFDGTTRYTGNMAMNDAGMSERDFH